MIKRVVESRINKLKEKFPILFITGPRQSGKTTLAKALFSNFDYISFENADNRNRFLDDPKSFLRDFSNGAIFDEAQRLPELFSYLQTFVDETGKMGRFILTGSQNFLLMESISQSLAGRVAIITLLPFSFNELFDKGKLPKTLDEVMLKGFYPPVWDRKLDPFDWYPQYISTYIERDVRTLKNITDLGQFQRFVALCAGRVGQLLNLSSLGNECGISHNTVQSWISLLESSYIAYRLQPYHKNFNKRVVKQPKLYFYDTGLVCSLLKITSATQLKTHYLRGEIFENWIINDYQKQNLNNNKQESHSFWRDHIGHEIDLIIERGETVIPIEIKSSSTVHSDFFKNLDYWQKLQASEQSGVLVYGGREVQNRRNNKVLPWFKIV